MEGELVAIFLGFETDPNFSNQKSGCRLKGRISDCVQLKKGNSSFLCLPRRFFKIFKLWCKTSTQIIGPTTNVFLKYQITYQMNKTIPEAT